MASYIIHILVTFLCLRLRLVFGQDYTYLGCFYDSNQREILPDLIYCDRSRHPYETCQNICGPQSQYCQSTSMTIELCRDICGDQNMKYFGLEAGSQCLCGGFFAPYNVLDQPTGLNDTCISPCSGDSSQMCGADFQSSVYQINEPASDCFNPGYVLNGDQSQQDSSFYNATDFIDFTSVCSSPSIKNGAASITCSTSGNWTDPPPTCTVRCATPTEPIHATFSAGQTLNNSYAVDDVVLFDCDNDATKKNQMLTCGYYGDWEIATMMVCPEPTTTVTTTTQPTTTLQPTTMMSSTTSITTPETSMTSGGGITTPQTMVTVANTTVPPVTTPTTTNATTPTEVSTITSATNATTTEPSSGTTSGGSPSTNKYQGSTSSTTTGPLSGPPLTSGNSPISGPTGSPTTESTAMTMSTMPSIVTNTTPSTDGSTSTPSSTSGAPSPSSPSSTTSNDAGSSSAPMTMMTSSPGGQGTSTPIVTSGSGKTTVDSGQNQGGEMDLIPIIIGAAAGVFVLILVIIVVSVCCSKKRKQKKKNIPFDPALGTSFGNPAFEEDEAEQSRRGFVQENDYSDRQTYDIGVSDYAMDVDEKNRVPPDGKDSPGVNGVEDATYAVVNKNRQGSVTSFKPDDHRVSWATLPPNHNNDINDIYEGNRHSPLIHENGYSEAYYTDPKNQVATPL